MSIHKSRRMAISQKQYEDNWEDIFAKSPSSAVDTEDTTTKPHQTSSDPLRDVFSGKIP